LKGIEAKNAPNFPSWPIIF